MKCLGDIYKRLQMGKKTRLPGFTIIEMLVVLFIISILLLLFVPNLSDQKDKAEEGSEKAIVKTVETQIELFKLNNPDGVVNEENMVPEYVSTQQWVIYEKHNDETVQ
ncbi:competence protein ComGC [Enterococcus saigonensis]|uniref:Competence protein ComGC n=1 Tax=Enterococcus saigonensis TaxID=1805431 RepID=A0A679IP78_9ENTE|nr:competence protein ComGC [Enterococcus saigonensis]